MKKTQLFLTASVLLLVSGFLPAGTLNFSSFVPPGPLSITIVADERGAPTRAPTVDAVGPVLRQRTGVSAAVAAVPEGGPTAEWVQGLIAGNNLPDVITGPALSAGVEEALVSAGAAWDFSDIPTLRKLFPNFTRRIDQWGDLTFWYANERTFGGTHVRLTQDVSPAALRRMYQAFKGSTYERRTINEIPGMGLPSALYLRDDILKMIYPRARTEKEQEQFFVKSFSFDNPTGASDPYRDIPITSMEGLRDYMRKAKEIIDSRKLTDGSGSDPMIAAQLSAAGSATSALDGTLTMYGYWWTRGPFRVADKTYDPWAMPWVKNVLAWWNACYNDGLLDPALFTKRDEQLADEISRGRFAIFPSSGNLVESARLYGKDKRVSYGWRQLPTWWPVSMKNTSNDASNQWVTYTSPSRGSVITRNVKEENLPQVANWLDFHYSEEFDILKTWGPSTFTTGEDMERRFRAAYRDLERFQVYGTAGPKDGYYYGILANSPASIDPAAWNWEVQIGSLTAYPLSPMYVYPQVARPGMSFDGQMLAAWTAYYHEKLVSFFPQVGWSDADLAALPTYARIRGAWSSTHEAAAAGAIVGPAQDFEAAYAGYQALFLQDDFQKGMAEYQDRWKQVFDASIRKYWKK